jgi:sporulation protein YlmC with PRC-barrel domain
MNTRSLLLAGTLSTILMAPAFAQDATNPATPANPAAPSVTAPGSTTGTMPSTDPAKTPDGSVVTGSTPGNEMFYSYTAGNTNWGVSKMLGKTVYNSANENIGEVEEIIIDAQGKFVAAIIGVGGFLGMGERDVAVTLPSIKMQPDGNGEMRLVVAIDRPTLEQAPPYTPNVNGG